MVLGKMEQTKEFTWESGVGKVWVDEGRQSGENLLNGTEAKIELKGEREVVNTLLQNVKICWKTWVEKLVWGKFG